MKITELQIRRILDALIDENNNPSPEAHCRPGRLLSHGSKNHMSNLICEAAMKAGKEPASDA